MLQLIKVSESVAARKAIPLRLLNTDGSPATGITLSGSELKVRKAGGNFANFAGTWTEIMGGSGDYDYTPTTGEVDTLGAFRGLLVKSGVQTNRFAAQVSALDPYTAFALTVRDLGEIDSGTSLGVTLTAISLKSTTKVPPANCIVEIMDGAFDGYMATMDFYNSSPKSITVDQGFPAGLVGTFPKYRLLGQPGSLMTDPPKVELTDAERATIIDDLLNTMLTAYTMAGTVGKKLNDAGSGGNPWASLVADNNAVNTFGSFFQTRLDAVITSRLAAGGYTVPPTAVQIRQEMDTNSTRLSSAATILGAVVAQTNKMVFTFTGHLDVNTVRIAGATVIGNGTEFNKWRG